MKYLDGYYRPSYICLLVICNLGQEYLKKRTPDKYREKAAAHWYELEIGNLEACSVVLLRKAGEKLLFHSELWVLSLFWRIWRLPLPAFIALQISLPYMVSVTLNLRL